MTDKFKAKAISTTPVVLAPSINQIPWFSSRMVDGPT